MQLEPRGTLTLSSGYRITLRGPIVDAPGLPKDGILVYYVVNFGDEPMILLRKLPSIPMAIQTTPEKPTVDSESLFAEKKGP